MTATCKTKVQQQSPVNLVGIVTRNHLWLQAEATDFSLLQIFQTGSGVLPPPIQWVPEVSFQGARQREGGC